MELLDCKIDSSVELGLGKEILLVDTVDIQLVVVGNLVVDNSLVLVEDMLLSGTLVVAVYKLAVDGEQPSQFVAEDYWIYQNKKESLSVTFSLK